MKEDSILINNRFVVYKNSNEVYDKELGQKKHVEPRLIKLLCLLADSGGKIVTRQYLIKEIWDDYPGASEGLNQAISFLRKLLADKSKEIIQTVPKKGYIFRAVILQKSVQGSSQTCRPSRRTMSIAVVILLILLLQPDWYSFDKGRPAKPVSEAKRVTEKALALAGIASAPKPEKIHHLKARKTPVNDDGVVNEKDLGKLARFDMKRDLSKIQRSIYKNTPANDDGVISEKNLGELASIDMKGDSNKMQRLKSRKSSMSDDGGRNEKNPGEFDRLDMKGD